MKSHQFIVFVLVFAFVLALTGYGQQTAEQLYQSALYKEEIEGELDSAIKVYQTIFKQYPENRPVAAKTQMHIGLCYEELGNAKARKAYDRVVYMFLQNINRYISIIQGIKPVSNIPHTFDIPRF